MKCAMLYTATVKRCKPGKESLGKYEVGICTTPIMQGGDTIWEQSLGNEKHVKRTGRENAKSQRHYC